MNKYVVIPAVIVGTIIIAVMTVVGLRYWKRKKCGKHEGFYLSDGGFCVKHKEPGTAADFTGADDNCFDSVDAAAQAFWTRPHELAGFVTRPDGKTCTLKRGQGQQVPKTSGGQEYSLNLWEYLPSP